MDAAVIPVFRWSGLFVGFFVDGFLFDANGGFFAWEDRSRRVWRANGRYLGERVDQHYVLRRVAWATPVPQPRRVPPVTPELPLPPPHRPARPPRAGWEDALAPFGLLPTADALQGDWANAQDRMHFASDGRYELVAGGRPPERGSWMLRGNLYLTPDVSAQVNRKRASAAAPEERDDAPADAPRVLVFRVLTYDGQRMTLRQLTQDRGLPFTMERRSARPTE
jgi:hypothetical protein